MICLVILILLKYTSGTPCGDTNPSTLNFTRGIFLPESFHVQSLPSFHACAVLCIHFNLCKSTNFDVETGKCYLHQHSAITDPSIDVSVKDTMYYVDSMDVPKFLSGGCDKHDCSMYDKCVSNTGKEYICLTYLKSQWKCLHYTSVEYATMKVIGFHNEAEKNVCESVANRVYYGNSPQKPKGCGSCHCCQLVFSSIFDQS